MNLAMHSEVENHDENEQEGRLDAADGPSLLDSRSSSATSGSVAVPLPASPRDMTIATYTRTGNAAGSSTSTSSSGAQPQRSRQSSTSHAPSNTGSDGGDRASAITNQASGDDDTAGSQDSREHAGLEAATERAGMKRRLAGFDVTLTFGDLNERDYLLPPTSRRERYRLQPGAGVNEPDLMLDIVLAGAPRRLTRPTFFEREFVAFGAEASVEGARSGQPQFSVVFAPLAGATEAASEVWVDEVVTDAKWISDRGVVVSTGSSLLLCGPPRATEGLKGFVENAGRLPAPAVEIAVSKGSAYKVACAVKGGMVAFTTVTDGRSNGKDPVILAEEKGYVGSVRWDPEDEHSFSYTVDNGHVVHVDTRQRPSAARRVPCFKGARTHTHVMSGGVWLVAGEGGRVALYDRRMGMRLAELRDPLLISVCDAHAHPATGKLVLFGHPGVTTWDVSRSCTKARGIAHGVNRAKSFSRQEVPPGFTENQFGAAGNESAGGGDSNGVASKEGLCYGSLLTSVQNEVLFGVVTAAPTGVVQVFRA